ncbi:MAG: extracellular solute-binding protein [Herpetosiphonaceae bacterium]|nr:extracellular solute-binding protein [Herpetosiphonaceae bacterium]
MTSTLLRLGTLIVLCVTLISCGTGVTPTASPPPASGQPSAVPVATSAAAAVTSAPATSAPVSDAKVTVRWWHINTIEAEAKVFQDLANDYMAANPNVTIDITVLENEAFKTRLTTAMQSGDPPDLFQSWGGGVLWQFADAKLVRNIAPELNGAWKDSFSTKAALELFGKDGEYYGAPWRWGAVGIFYNKELFAKAGLDPAAPPKTWDEFLSAVKALKAAGITPIALGEKEKWPGHFWWVYLAIRAGGEQAFLAAYDRSGTFNDAPFVEAGTRLKELIDLEPFQDGYLGLGYADQAALMGNGEAAMELMGQWAPPNQASNSTSGEGLGENLSWFPFPALPDGAGNPTDVLGGGDGFAVGINAPDATVDFLRYLTSLDVQKLLVEKKMAIPPVIKGAADQIADPVMQQIVAARDGATYSQLYYDQFLPPAVGEAVNDAVEQLFVGVATPEEVSAQIEDAASSELR